MNSNCDIEILMHFSHLITDCREWEAVFRATRFVFRKKWFFKFRGQFGLIDLGMSGENGGIRSIFPLKNSLRSRKSQFISSRETLELVFKIPPRRSNSWLFSRERWSSGPYSTCSLACVNVAVISKSLDFFTQKFLPNWLLPSSLRKTLLARRPKCHNLVTKKSYACDSADPWCQCS